MRAGIECDKPVCKPMGMSKVLPLCLGIKHARISPIGNQFDIYSPMGVQVIDEARRIYHHLVRVPVEKSF